MQIHGIPIRGKVPEQYIKTLSTIEKLTPLKIWKGIKAIYISDKQETLDNCKGAMSGGYCRSNRKTSKMRLTLIFNDSTRKKYKLVSKDFPCILIDGGILPDEYSFLVNLLHEVGHHKNRKRDSRMEHKQKEINAHRFALKYLKEKTNTPFQYWQEAIKIENLKPLKIKGFKKSKCT